MNLQIDLFSNSRFTGSIDKIMSPLLKSRFVLKDADLLSPYSVYCAEDIFTREHINTVLLKSRRDRNYDGLFGLKVDSHIELEKAGLSADTRNHPYRVVVSLADSLDLILSGIAECDWEGISDKIDNYQLVSRGMLTLNFKLLQDMSFNVLFGIDPKIDLFIGKRENNTQEIVQFIFECLLRNAQKIASYIALEIKHKFTTDTNDVVLKSRSYSEVVLSSREPIDEVVTLTNGYSIAVKSFLAQDYLKHVGESFRRC